MNAMLESWNLGLSTAFIIVRCFKLFWLLVFYIGRIDVQFLAPGVGRLFGSVDVDAYPLAFRKDILIHEAVSVISCVEKFLRTPYADSIFVGVSCCDFVSLLIEFYQHRHPYMERWAFLYMLKLRYGKRFGTRAGAVWRILYVLSLMPWMRKYRVNARPRLSRLPENVDRFSFDDIYFEKQELELEVEGLRADQYRIRELEDEVKALRKSMKGFTKARIEL